jgi:hypothetical protein
LLCDIVAQASALRSNVRRQVEAPSASFNSTTLANSSEAPTLFSASINPAPFATRSLSPNANDFSGTLNLDVLYAAATRADPMGLVMYGGESNWDRFSVTVDHSASVDNLATDIPANTNTYMAKASILPKVPTVLISPKQDVGGRDRHPISTITGDPLFKKLKEGVVDFLYKTYRALYETDGSGKDPAQFEKTHLTGTGFREIWGRLTRADKNEISDRVASYLMDARKLGDPWLDAMFERLQDQLGVSADFTSRISYSGKPNLYRAEAIFDKGFGTGTFNSTTNLSYDFQDSQSTTPKNRQILRVVEQMTVPLGSVPWTPSVPVKEVLSGEGDFGTNGTPMYKGQFKIVVPLPLGWAVPLVFQYANRTAAGPRPDIKAQIGLTLDLDKTLASFYGLPHSMR